MKVAGGWGSQGLRAMAEKETFYHLRVQDFAFSSNHEDGLLLIALGLWRDFVASGLLYGKPKVQAAGSFLPKDRFLPESNFAVALSGGGSTVGVNHSSPDEWA